MKNTLWASLGWLGRTLRRHFLAGILVVVPIGATLWILLWIFTVFDGILRPYVELILGRTVPGVGFVITIVLIYLIGAVVSNVLGRRLFHFGESLLAKVPVVRPLYASIKQILESFSVTGKSGLGQTVLIEFPRKDIWTVGFITNEVLLQSGEIRLNIFIPTSPNPASGFLQIVKEDEVIRTDIPVDQALRMIISAGKVSPEEITSRLSERKG